MKRALSAVLAPVFAGAFILSACMTPAAAQTTSATVVAACGTPPSTYTAGANRALTQDTTGTLCSTGSGGGGGGGAVYGPNANGAAASHPPVIIGGTADASATGTVQNAKVDSSGNAYTVLTNVEGTKAAGTAATKSALTGGVYNSSPPSLSNGQQAATQMTSAGSLKVLDDNSAALLSAATGAIPAGTNAIGTLTGSTAYGLQSAASTNSTSVKGSAGVLKAMNLINTTTTIYYLRMYNLSSAPTCSSATGFVRTWPIPPAASSGLAGGIAANLGAGGTTFSTGIAFCLTGGPTSTDNTNAATGVFVNLDYQ